MKLLLALLAASVLAEPLTLVRPVESLTPDQEEIIIESLHSTWAAKVTDAASRTSKKTDVRKVNEKRLDGLKDGGGFGYGFERLKHESLTLRRILTIPGRSLNSGSYIAKPASLIDDENIIIELRHSQAGDGETIWITGLDVSRVLSEDKNVPIDAVFMELEPRSYSATDGTKQTVRQLAPLKDGYIKELWEQHKKNNADKIESDFIQLCKEAKSKKSGSPYNAK